ncbi:putative redox protein [Kushneria sinocarnis]|uniref:Putative redox protein n=1 Tax=Kushneria sinocarnis TaxID=595502 RepID=A0A420WZ33_9GAMM|nr:OsmC family protein [Kushneria sinocarnis]RKR06601.1 putative redox protein [Kushneria sinocarnis]
MKARVKWTDGRQFVTESGSGHAVVIDGNPENGGRNTGPRPMEMMLMGLGGCTSYDVINILEKARADVTDCVAEIEAERADSTPAVFTRIHIHFVVTGRSLKEDRVKRAVELSAEKYCSASLMLERGGVEISHDYEIHEAHD